MDLKRCIEKDYETYVKARRMDDDLRRALLRHERKGVYIASMCFELKQVKKLTRDQISECVISLTEIFIQKVVQKFEERTKSDNEKLRITETVDKFQKIKDELQEDVIEGETRTENYDGKEKEGYEKNAG